MPEIREHERNYLLVRLQPVLQDANRKEYAARVTLQHLRNDTWTTDAHLVQIQRARSKWEDTNNTTEFLRTIIYRLNIPEYQDWTGLLEDIERI